MAVVICVVISSVWVMLALGFRYLETRQRHRLIATSLNIHCHPGWADELEAWLHQQP